MADVDATAGAAVRAGGAVVTGPYSAPGGRRIAVLRDPQGAAFGVYRAGEEG